MRYLKIFLAFILLLVPLTVSADNLPKITLKLDKKILKTDVAPVIVNDRTLVPIRVISEASGAEVEWDGENRVVTITGDEVEIKLTIDSNEALVNEEAITLDAPAQIISDRTMVPVRFVAESFGYTVKWNGETRTVFLTSPEPEKPEEPEKPGKDDEEPGVANLVTVGSANTDKGYRITIKFDVPLTGEYTMFELDNPQRLIVDFENAQIDYTRQFDFTNETVKAARVGNHDDFMRVVIDMEEPAEYKTYLSENEDALILFFDVESDETEIPDETTDDKKDETDEEKVENIDDGEFIIVIDPGHGGSDPGALGKEDGETVARESEVNLEVALLLRDILEDEGITVVMTRDDDDRVSLGDRCVISNNAKADLFVSIHSNAMEVGYEHINGTMVFYGEAKDKKDPWLKSKDLAASILDYLHEAIETEDLGVQNGDQLAVIRGTEAPAVLVELAFITNPDDREKLTDSDYQELAAQGIADGIFECIEDVLE